jgi:hypothetical protein
MQDNVQYAAYGSGGANGAGQVSGEQQDGFIYQQTTYSNGSTVEGQQYASELHHIQYLIFRYEYVF